ncbi:non-ribosomal peptide synthase/polyketide synthase [Pseudomonas kermanshahensis]|nr:non-ribosomal peptide synthase/polyketide synthase [Pseudomonas kermanshahensis]WEL58164.1 non-ribosomal peptide synthase/polyketide synthase [Pseudomonas kermanshahensis]
MHFSELMAALSTRAIRLQREDQDLIVLGDDDTLDDSLWEALSRHKPALLEMLAERDDDWLSPAFRITPDMLPLVTLDQEAIDRIVASVPGGAANVQDIYPLAPLQQGMLYHHLSATEGDPYLSQVQLRFASKTHLEAFAEALQWVIQRHDILRTALHWEYLDQPVQVVWQEATLVREAVPVAGSTALAELCARFDPRQYRLDLRQAPLMQLMHAQGEGTTWVALLMFHHVVMDHTALDIVRREIQAHIAGQSDRLAAPMPFRNVLAAARQALDEDAHERFFREMLGDIDEPTLAFGLQDKGDVQLEQARLTLPPTLSQRLRSQARQLGVSPASVLHLGFGRLIGQLSGRQQVVFGSVLLGRMTTGDGSEQALGMFINSLPLRIDLGPTSVRDALLATHRRLSALLGHEQASLALAQRCSGVAAPAPLFNSLLNYRHSDVGDAAEVIPVAAGIDIVGAEERTDYPLTVSVDDLGDALRLTVQSLPAWSASRLCAQFEQVLASLVDALEHTPTAALQGLQVLPPAERDQVLQQFNHTAQLYPQGQTVHAMVEARAATAPAAVALLQDGQALRYDELNRRANQLAHQLIERGVQVGDRVALCLPRNSGRVVALLAVLKAGAAYVPVDPAYPAERIAYLLADSAPALVVSETAVNGLPAEVPRLDLDPISTCAAHDSNPQRPGLDAQQLAYVVYTSGSTGQPKGVMIEHHTLANLVHWHCQAFALDADAHTSSVAGFGFDAMAWEVWPALCAGATLHLPPAHIANEHVDELLDWWLLQPLKVSFLPTPVAEQALRREHQHPTLRTLLVGGDRLRQFERGPGFALINNYGPTETTVVATSGQVLPNGALHIGRPIANTRVYVLDEGLQPVPVGVAGELFIGGAQVARGYFNRPALTEQAFLVDPFSEQPNARMYRSGDRVRWNADGTLDYLGRNDDQVKIRGVRVELGEIEATLAAQPGIDAAVVLVRGERLLAWFTETAPVALDALRQALQACLPAHMVPLAFVRLDELPLTSHGKLDRRALPDPEASQLFGQGYEAPTGETEVTMAAIWADVLGVQRVGRHDNFFELGGHSLLAVTLVERLRKAGLLIDVRVLFAQPTLAALAGAAGIGHEVKVPANRVPAQAQRITPSMLSLIDLDQAAIDDIVATVPGGAANVQEIYPLAPLQEGILYHHLSAEQGDPYLLQTRLAFDSVERLLAWAGALQQVIDRHDILRTAVLWQGLAQPLQVVWRKAELVVSEIDDLADDDGLARVEQLHARFDARHHRLDLTQAPLTRLYYSLDPANQQVVAILLFHHLTLDHTAMDVVAREMRALLFGQGHTLPAAVPYRNYVAQARLGDQAAHEAFFREMLADVEEPTLPLGYADVQGDGRGIETALQALDGEVAHGLRTQARQLGVSTASLMHLAWARVLGVLANRDDVVFGTVLMGRLQGGEGADRALGMFINTLPLRVDTTLAVRAAVRATHRNLSALLGHEHAPLALAQRCSGVAASAPLFSALLNYRHSADAATGEAIWEGVRLLGGEERSNYPLTLSVNDLGEGFTFSVLAIAGIGAARVAAWMVNAVTQLLQALQQGQEARVDSLSILSDEARQQLLGSFNATAQHYPQGQTVHALVEARAAETPDATAVSQDGQALSYGDLNLRANRLAHQLIARGVRGGDRVALCVGRSAERVIGLLAVLKAGAAYVPVDPGYPAERIAYLLADSAPALVLSETGIAGLPADIPRLNLDQAAADDALDSNPHVPGLDAHHLAYLVYTSGSTGQPKGVMIEHHTLANLVHWHCQAFALEAGVRTSSVAGFGFDAMAWEVWPALCAGATLHLPPAHIGNEHVDELLDWWLEQPLAVSFLPTPVAEQALRRERQHPTLRTLLIGGDRLRQFDRDPGFALVNNYGPTETTVVATSGQVLPGAALHIGKPIANTRVYVLDAHRQAVPVGVVGELYIGGAQVARGYFNRPELTEERFLADPFSRMPGARMYRSGDLVRWNADGTLDYLGRNDDQVKIRGVRVELGEIEAALTAQAGIADAVVLVRGERLVAWFTEQVPVAFEVVRHALQASLPGHMVPQAFIRLDQWPLTSHGKLDRRALPEPDAAQLISQGYEAPASETEAAMACVWADVLGVERVGRHDNFFELGGHSLLAVTVIERLRQQGLQTDVRVLFGQPTVAALAAALGNGRQVSVPENRIPAGCTHITPAMLPLLTLDASTLERIVATVPGGAANVQDIYPLAPLQEGILYHHLSAAGADPYLLQWRVAFDSHARLLAFARALDKVIARHDILRTAVLWDGLVQPVQVVWRSVPGSVLVNSSEATGPLDLSQAPLIRLLQTPQPGTEGLEATLQFHHIALDHTAMKVVLEEIRDHLRGQQPSQPAVPYRNYVAQARLAISEAEHEAFFRAELADIDEPTLPYGLVDLQGQASAFELATVQLAPEQYRRLRSLAQQLGVSAASVLHLAWARLVAATSGNDRVVFGTVLLGRLQGGAGADRGLGMFINTLPLRLDLQGLGVRAGVRLAHQRLSALLVHEHASLALAQRCSGVAAPTPLFSAMLNYRHGASQPEQQAQREALEGIQALPSGGHGNYPLSVNVDDLGDGLRLTAQVSAQVGAQRVCDQLLQVLHGLLDALEHAPDTPVQQLPVLTPGERRRLLANAPQTPHDMAQPLHGLFEAQVRRTPTAIALVAEEGELSYRQLDEQANRLAHHLIGLGVKPDDRVAICVERGLSMVVGLLAILKAGGAYVPVDPGYPAERIRHMLSNSAPLAVLMHSATREVVHGTPVQLIDLDQPCWEAQPISNPRVASLNASHLAYVIYTSGSTGQPKGVMVEHRNVVNLVRWSQRLRQAPGLGAVLHKTPVSFDASVWELFWPLCSGLRLVLARPHGQRDPHYLAQLIESQHISVVQFVPALLQQFLEAPASARCASLSDIVCGGGELTQALAAQVRERLPGVRLHNVYGPTETTVDCSVWTLEPGADLPHGALPIGTAIDNTRLYVLDHYDQPVPWGVVGHLHIGGAGVARGYLGLPEQQAERFIASPFVNGDRLYRSGDLVRQREDGNLVFLGRNDHQVKIRGLRIEPGEIEACLVRVPGVRDAVVLAYDAPASGPRLVAYLTGEPPVADSLRQALLQDLPEYLLPAQYIHLDQLPLTPNGKLDRKALPAPDAALQGRPYQAPQGQTETLLAQLWAQLLGVEHVGRHDNFFELGGHSLLAVSLTARLRLEGLQVDVRTLFGQPTVAALAETLGHNQQVRVPENRIPAGCTHITPCLLSLIDLDQPAIDRIVARVPGGASNVQDIYPLAPLQEGILYHHLSAEHDPYVLYSRLRFDNDERLQAFASALDQVIARHDVLRTAVLWDGLPQAVQVVWRHAPLQVLRDDDAATVGLDLSQAPLIRLLHRQAPGSECIEATLQFHHIVLDHTALEVVGEELIGFLQGTPPVQTPVPYRNYVAQARLGISQAEHESFFREQLADVDEPTLPFGLSDVQGDGLGMQEAKLALSAELAAGLRRQARHLGISVASLFHLAWARLLAAASGKDRVVFGTVLLGRLQGGEGAERALGMFINTLPLRVDLGAVSLREGAQAVHQRLSALLAHEHASLALAQRCSAVATPLPLFSAMLNYRHGAEASAEQRQAWQGIDVLEGQERTNYPLSLNVDDLGEGLRLVAMTPADVGAARICGQMNQVLEAMIEALEQTPELPVQRLPVLEAQERERVLRGFNDTAVGYDLEQTLHGMIEAQVLRTPDALAVTAEEGALSYRELNEQANRLAHHLIGLGVKPDDRVAICVERGLSMVVGLLAILKAGGAYVPVDPDYPSERVRHMLSDSAPVAVLVHSATRHVPDSAQVIDLDQPTWNAQPSSNPVVTGLTPRHLAYVIYTSGSTGLPKGVMNEHAGVVNRLLWMQDAYNLGAEDVVLQKTPFSFDVSVWEFLWPLQIGARLVMARPGGHRDPEYLRQVIRSENVTTLHFVPSMLDVFLAHGQISADGLKRVLCSGEALPGSLVRRFHTQLPTVELHNLYGPTEAAVDVTAWHCVTAPDNTPIGKPIANTTLYVLDSQGQPVPQGVAGELFIGGVQVARGYLNRAELTAERFLEDPFSTRPGARLYRTGDLARHLADGNIEYLGRNDDQVKLRGLRIELGEIQAGLTAIEGVKEAVVIARDHRLVAYYTGEQQAADVLRTALLAHLPEFMVPALFLHLDALPLSPNGKLDRKALPQPDTEALQNRVYEAPEGETETLLAAVWAELLGVERVGRHDNFFELGGHSLLAVTLTSRLRQQGLHADIRVLFGQPTLAALAAAVGGETRISVPANRIPAEGTRITPDMLPLAELSQAAIDTLVTQIPGGVVNVQDVYGLAPLQQGILYHHLASEGADPYVLQARFAFPTQAELDAFATALDQVIARHDILRTSIHWQGLEEPVQVVWRTVPAVGAALRGDESSTTLDLNKAPLIRLLPSHGKGRVEATLLIHHIILDHAAVEQLVAEITAVLQGQALSQASVPYRNYVAQARLGADTQADEALFRELLGDIDEPTTVFGLRDALSDGSRVLDSRLALDTALAGRLREQARLLGISVASLVHQAWGQVLAQLSGREEVVFGTVLLGRLQGGEGAERALGMFINTLPLRVSVGATAVAEGVRLTHQRLARLLAHEQASLALAQRCSAVPASQALFTSLLNFRHSAPAKAELRQAWQGIEQLAAHERSNYPLVVNVDDVGDAFVLTVQAVPEVDGAQVCRLLSTALEQLAQALAQAPTTALHKVSQLAVAERELVLQGFNATRRDYPREQALHTLFGTYAALSPAAPAVVHGGRQWSYEQLEEHANRLAHHLLALGVRPGDRVALLLPRSIELLAAQLAASKCAAVFVPLDSNAPAERQAFMIEDSQARVLLTFSSEQRVGNALRVELDRLDLTGYAQQSPGLAVAAESAAYIMYTSGSTGTPKGVQVPHRAIVRLVINNGFAEFTCQDRVAFASNPAFDASTLEVWAPLLNGGTVVVIDQDQVLSRQALREVLLAQRVSVLWLTAGLFHQFADDLLPAFAKLRYLMVGGDVLDPAIVGRVLREGAPQHLLNGYGPTEATTFSTTHLIATVGEGSIPIGRPIGNARCYVLDARQQPLPVGAVGELYIGGAGVALGYLGQPALTAERFLEDPFSREPGARMYRSGDLACWQADGTLRYLGRADQQIKLRGFRIELGEIEARLGACAGVRDTAVVVREDVPGDKRLVAYFTANNPAPGIAELHQQLQGQLPDYMLPAAYVCLDALPLTANGKLDRRALPQPGNEAVLSRAFEAPQGEVETTLAAIWADLLKVAQVGRQDHFFELGGHSLLAVTLVERMRKAGLSADVRVLFAQPTLASLAAAVGSGREVQVPANRVPHTARHITPDMLSLIELDQASIDRIVATVPGGASNVQEIYPLAPLQEGILYHHLSAAQGDPYLLQSRLAFDSLAHLQRWTGALQQVIDRHDILRTAVVSEGLAHAVQVVWREARMQVSAIEGLATESVIDALQARFDARHQRLDLSRAPLLRLLHADDPANQRVVAILQFHHLALDHTAMEVIASEMQLLLAGQGERLPAPVPYRTYVAQARLGADDASHEAFFREMLGDLDAPTLPFGLSDVQGDGHAIEEAHLAIDASVARGLREQARQLGVSAASLAHLAWARVLGVLANRTDVVFGTVLMGRLQGGEGADRALGVFINTLPLRIDLTAPVAQAVRATHQRLSALLAHEHASLALAQRCSGVAASTPLFSALFNYRHSTAGVPADSDTHSQGVRLLGGEERSNYPLTLSVDDLGEGFALSVLAQAGIGAERVAGWMNQALVELLQALTQSAAKPVEALSILDPVARQQVLEVFNATARDYPKGQAVHALVEAQAARAPQAAALVQDGQVLSYGELNRCANRLAHHLISRGVGVGDRVALCLPRTLERLVGLLAILKAGAAYVPIDPAYPGERIAYLLEDSTPALVLVDAATLALVGDTPRVELHRDAWQGAADSNPCVAGLDDRQLAYVIYTSGSTGQPKGVMVEHATLANLVHWHCEAFALKAGSHTSTVAGFGFDAVAWEVWPALCTGAVLHVPPARIAGEHVDELLDWWLEQPLAVSFLPTPVAEQALRRERQHPTLRTLLVGGDRLRQFERDPGFALVNNYGPTEATVVATSGQLVPAGALHIGKPIANTQVYVLDERRQPVPVGAVGELYIGGAGVARGYFNRPALTEERFIADPFSAQPHARLYRTGDLVRWNADGTLDYLGRNDDQVKIRGVRVELGEIESVLAAQPGIGDAVVLVRGERLLAWFTETTPVAVDILRQALQASLPAHLVPLAFTCLPVLPLTSHGKLDRKALPDPDPALLAGQAYVAPQGEVEMALAAVWADMLGVERVGRHDNFFELGGHSLLAVNLTARLRREGVQVDVRTLFGQPTVAALATTLGQVQQVQVPDNLIPAGCPHITPGMLPLVALEQAAIDRIVAQVPGGARNVQDIYPLAPLQEGILYHHLSAQGHDPYVLQSRFGFASREHLNNFAAALDKVIARHDVLRTAVLWEGLPQPVQVVWRQAPLSVMARGRDSEAMLDLSKAPLIRLLYTQQPGAARIEAILQFHHIVLDHTAMEVVGEELIGYLQDAAEPAQAPVPYRNYVAQARLGISQAEHEAFFRGQLADIDAPTLPFGLSDVQGDGRDIEEAQLWLRDDLAQRLRQQGRQLGISVASLFHLAWARLLAAASGQDSVVFGTVLLGRLQGGEGAERALGMFINTLPLRVDLGGISLREGARATHQRLSALLAHEHASLALAQRCSGVAAPLPLFSAMLNYRHSTQVTDSQRQATQGIDNLESQERSNYPLGLNVDDLGEGFRLVAMTPADVGAARICGQMNQVLEAMVEALEQTPELPVQRLPVLEAQERERVLLGFNDTAVGYDLKQTLHGMIEAQVLRTPDALAVKAEEGALSYRELNEQANGLAHHLIGLGVKPDDRVAICVERGLSMVVGLLAILKAGGAYVPVDPDYPAERVRHMLSDSAPVAVLVHSATRHVPDSAQVIDLDQPTWNAQPSSNPVVTSLTPRHLAYVIYTSGSTGLPKGVMNEHAGVVNRLLWMQDAYNLGADDVVLQKTPFSFDVSVWEFLWPLQTGARLVMARPGGHRDPEYLRRVIRSENVTTLHFVPSMLDVFLAHGQISADGLKRVLCSGEALPGSLVRRFHTQLPTVELHNLYGPTEAAVDVSAWHCVTAPDNTPIGKPIANTTLYVLDSQGQPVPQGVAGELFIGGVQVARGYLNRAELTAERFLEDPFSTRPGARLYRTGDLARHLADGTIEYLGRNDDQVKLRGLRIELGEIQAGLTAIEGVKEAVVVARDQRLVAYYTGEQQAADVLRTALLAHLPEFMVPALFLHLDALPLSPNGKLDRKALPLPDTEALQNREYQAPEGETETLLATIWAELLGVERVGRHDNFFELGGHSLLAVTLTSRLRDQGLEADVRALFDQPTLAGYAAITDRMEIVL